jgi:hypothetical protein
MDNNCNYEDDNSQCSNKTEIIFEILYSRDMILKLAKNETTISNDEFFLEIVDSKFPKENPQTSSISLGECENKLKEVYNIPFEDSLLILKIDLIRNLPTPQVEYKVYDKKGNELNLDCCKDLKIEISYPVNPNMIENKI